MSPQSFQLKDGRIINIANFPAVNNSSEIFKDPITGKVFLAGSVVPILIEDTYVDDKHPDNNYATTSSMEVKSNLYFGVRQIERAYLKCSPNKTLHLYCIALRLDTPIMEIREVNPDSYDVTTLTWNNQPALGNQVSTFTNVPGGQWLSIPTGTTGAICLKFLDEPTVPLVIANTDGWNSMEYFPATGRPYLT